MPRVQHDPRSVLSRPADPPDVVLRWADAATHGGAGVVDVYLPGRARGGADHASDPALPPVVLLHGGFWREEYDRRHVRPLAVALRGTGRTVVVPEYRRAGGWPAVTADIAAVRDRLPRLLAQAGLDVAAPVLVGHSAGGQLAMWWALGADAAPTRVVALAPVADLTLAYRDRLGDDAVQALLGEPADRPESYADADVAARLRSGERVPPVVVLHGTEDAQVPVEHSRALAADVDAVELRELPGTGHHELIDPLSAAWPHLLRALGSAGRPDRLARRLRSLDG